MVSKFGVCVILKLAIHTYYFELYRGVDKSLEPEGATYSLVIRMMDKGDLLYKGYHLGLDNYFSSPKLFLDLFAKATVATGR